jgi:hypothetical protein
VDERFDLQQQREKAEERPLEVVFRSVAEVIQPESPRLSALLEQVARSTKDHSPRVTHG